MLKTWQKGILLVISFLSTLALNINMDHTITTYSINGVQESGRNIVSIVLFVLLYKFFSAVWERRGSKRGSLREFLCCLLPSILFSTFMVFGYSFAMQDNWELVLTNSNKLQILTAAIFWFGYLGFFYFVIMYLFSFTDNVKIMGDPNRKTWKLLQKYYDCLKKKPFSTTFFTLLLIYIPYMVLSYPAIFMSDTYTQILQGYNLPEGVPPYMDLDNASVKWNNHHPIMHTLLIHLCIRLGVAIFSSYNIGIFIFALLQAIGLWVAVSFLIKTLIEKQISVKLSAMLLLYFIISPWVQNYTFLITKDVFYSIFLLLFVIALFRFATEPFTAKIGCMLACSSLGLLVSRNDGKYLVLITLFCCFFLLKKVRKQIGVLAVGVLVFSMLLSNVLYPILQITPGSKREMLSIPFQQTARYICTMGENVTPEENAAISAVLDYEHILTHYNPEVSDGVKDSFREDATTEELITYFKVWFQMLLKHPGIYIQATMNNVYSYFYPEYYAWPTGSPHYDSYEWSAMVMDLTNTVNPNLPSDFHYPSALNELRTHYELLRETIVSLPILSALVTPAFYAWILILWFFYCIRKKELRGLACMIPLLLVVLICVASPVNGWYTRYIFPVAFSLPGALLGGLWITRQSATEQ